MLGGAESPGGGGAELLTVTVARDEHGYGMKVSGDNPVYVQSVKEHGAAWRAGLRAGDRILRVDSQLVAHHSHQQVVQMIRANPTTVLTVQQHASRLKTPITAPVPANIEKQRQFEASKVKTMRLMLEKEQKYIRDLRGELLKVPDVRKSAELESAEQRCSTLQREIDVMMGTGQLVCQPTTPRNVRTKIEKPTTNPSTPNTGFLSGLPRSLSNLTGQSLRNLRQARQKNQQENQPPLVRQNSDESNNKRRHIHNNTVPMVPTTCLDNSPPPLPPRSIERPKRSPTSPLSPSPLANPSKKYYKPLPETPRMSQSMPAYDQHRRSSYSLDGELDGPLPNSIALQMSYPLVNVPPPPLQMDNRNSVPVLHMRSRSSPEQLDHDLSKSSITLTGVVDVPAGRGAADPPRDSPPPGTPPPPYHTNTQPCADPQRAIISMEEDDSPASDNSTYSGLFSNLRSVRESKARTAVLLNWLLGERRCACACLLLVLTDSYRAGTVPIATLRRWAYEIHSSFLMPHAVLQLTGVDENMANEIEHVLVNEFEKEELLRNVFRKARHKAKEELAAQLSEFQVKRQVGLAALYGPADCVIDKCDVDRVQEQAVVERLLCGRLRQLAAGAGGAGGAGDAQAALTAALAAAALCLQCRPAAVVAAAGCPRAAFLQRDKLYKQRVKHLAKQHPQPFVVRGHHLQLQALTCVAHCHHCDNVIAGLAPQAYFCTDCKLRVHCACAKQVEEPCCIDGEHHNNRISRFMERIHHNNQINSQDSTDKKSRKASGTANFLNMERSFRKAEDEQPWDQTLSPATIERRDESDESLYESADGHSDAISASDDAFPRLGKTPTISKESLKLAVTDEEADTKFKKGHRKAMSLSNPIEMVKHLGDEWLEAHKKELEKNSDKKKSRESLWSEEDKDSVNGSSTILDQIRKNSRKEDKSQSNSRKSSTADAPKTRKTSKGSSVSALNFLRRKKTPTSMKPVEVVPEDPTKLLTIDEILDYTRLFLEREKRFASIENRPPVKPQIETDSDDEEPPPKQLEQHRRRLSRQTSRSKSKVRGKSQSLKVNTLRKSHSGTLKKNKKKGSKTPSMGRSRQTSIVEQTPIVKKKHSQSMKQNSWLFSGSKGETRREGSTEEPAGPDADVDASDAAAKDSDKDNTWRGPPPARGVSRAESCRERDAPRRGKHRNASDPNRLTAHNNNDLEPGSATVPSGSSSSSSLSSRSNESNTVPAEQQASQSELSDEDEALAAQWADSISPHVLSSISLSSKLRKRQEVIHELIVSEGSHVRWLKVLGTVFLRPLESQPALLSPEELRALFPNLPSVRERHAKLYSELRALRNDVDAPLVDVRAVADAMLNTLGDAGYASTLARFCRGQRMALEALRERRRKNKELHQFLAAREQLPLCGRLQLRDLLACVWQRLTKYQLLLESVLKTVEEAEGEGESASEAEHVRRALRVAKDVLHGVDTAVRTAENEHRLRSIQAKLEVRAPGGAEWEELRRLDLTAHALALEGELALRNDSNKKIHVLALMLEECLVLLQREGDRFLLKPIAQPSHTQNLSPLIKWDKVLFRPNAAVRNTFFLMNINGVQMHELSANSASEYATWVKHIQEAPLAKLTELKPNITPSHQASRSTDDSGINVSRNPSDASEKSNSTVEEECEREQSVERAECERDRASAEPALAERDKERCSAERDERVDKDEGIEKDDKQITRRPTVGRISTHGAEPPPALEGRAALTVTEPATLTALTALSNRERLRRLDAGISRCLRAKALVVGELLGLPPAHYAQVAELAVAEALGHVDVSLELNPRGPPEEEPEPDMQQLLLAACTQANQLTLLVRGALAVSEGGGVAARAGAGRCAACRGRGAGPAPRPAPQETDVDGDVKPAELREQDDAPAERECDEDDDIERSGGAARLAARLLDATCGLQATLARLLAGGAGGAGRGERAALRDCNDGLRARLRAYEQTREEISFPKEDPTMQDQPSNGG